MKSNAPVVYNPVPEKHRPFSGSVLKLIAVITMLVDHIGAGILYPWLLNRDVFFSLSRAGSIKIYRVFRGIGRIAFPVYCFLLVEGFFHTGNRKRYLLRMGLFALISEMPFNLALVPGDEHSHTLHLVQILRTNRDAYFQDQNVFFTLFFGLAVIWIINAAYGMAAKYAAKRESMRIPCTIGATLVSLLAFEAGCFIAELHKTDYGKKGIVLIVVLYLLYRIRPLALAAGYGYFTFVMPNEIWSLPGFVLMLLYNGKRGFIKGKLNYVFYAFYPVHLMLIYVVRTFLL